MRGIDVGGRSCFKKRRCPAHVVVYQPIVLLAEKEADLIQQTRVMR